MLNHNWLQFYRPPVSCLFICETSTQLQAVILVYSGALVEALVQNLIVAKQAPRFALALIVVCIGSFIDRSFHTPSQIV